MSGGNSFCAHYKINAVNCSCLQKDNAIDELQLPLFVSRYLIIRVITLSPCVSLHPFFSFFSGRTLLLGMAPGAGISWKKDEYTLVLLNHKVQIIFVKIATDFFHS